MKCCLVGASLAHSYSKKIHERLGRYAYDLVSLEQEELESFLSSRQYTGINVTIPYKKAVMAFCDELSPLAKDIGSVNTLYIKDGKLIGTNTDYHGFCYACQMAGISFHGKKVLILGSGGTSQTARKAAADLGADEVLIASRQPGAGCISYDQLPGYAQIIVNTTPVGMYPKTGSSPIVLSDFPSCQGVVDVVYNPFYTDLLLQAQEAGLPFTGGLPMLVAQATKAAFYFTGMDFHEENRRIIDELTGEVENIVLIGMPGCGKTTLGKLLAARLGKTFVDLDHEVEKLARKPIPEIFSENGEDYFRALETKVTEKVGKEWSQVIATGGGTVLRRENMAALKQNGRILFLECDLGKLATEGRPLSKDLKTMYEFRKPLYNKYCDLTFQLIRDIDTDLNKLLGGICK